MFVFVFQKIYECEDIDLTCGSGWLLIKEIKNPCVMPIDIPKRVAEGERKNPIEWFCPKEKRRRGVSFADDAGIPLNAACVHDSTDTPDSDSEDSMFTPSPLGSPSILRNQPRYPSPVKSPNLLRSQPRSPMFMRSMSSPMSCSPSLKMRDSDDISSPACSPCNWRRCLTPIGVLETLFDRPVDNLSRFVIALQRDCVALESLTIERNKTLLGRVRVLDIGDGKDVIIRWSSNAWESYCDVPCVYVAPLNSTSVVPRSIFFHAEELEVFDFSFDVASSDQHISFAVCYTVSGQCFWDNNCGRNYELRRKYEGKYIQVDS